MLYICIFLFLNFFDVIKINARNVLYCLKRSAHFRMLFFLENYLVKKEYFLQLKYRECLEEEELCLNCKENYDKKYELAH